MPAGRRPPRLTPPDRSGAGFCLPAALRPGVMLSFPANGNDGGLQTTAIAAWQNDTTGVAGGVSPPAATARPGRR
jgi:hypothetical protein